MRAMLACAVVLAGCGSPEPRERAISTPVEAVDAVESPSTALRTGPSPSAPREGWTEELSLESAPFDTPGAPSVLVHAGPAFDPARPLRLAIFLHGWSGCARMLMRPGSVPCRDGEPAREGWDLEGRFDDGGSDALFVVPQLALMRRDGSAGLFLEDGRFERFLREMLAGLGSRIRGADLARVESIALFAHSAGYETALALIARGGVEVSHVVLFDALYRGVEPFLAWAAEDPARRLVSLYTGEGRTARQSAMLALRASSVFGEGSVARDLDRPLAGQVASHRVVIARSPAPHGLVPARHIAELLAPLGLAARHAEEAANE